MSNINSGDTITFAGISPTPANALGPTHVEAFYELKYNATHYNSRMTEEGFEAALAEVLADKVRNLGKEITE